MVKLALAQGLSVEAKRGDGRTPLHVACRSHTNPVPLLRALLESGATPSPRDAAGMTPLMHCAAAGNAQGVGLLLRVGGPDAAFFIDSTSRDALDHALAGRGDTGVVHRLLQGGLSANNRLSAAAQLGEAEVLSLLASHGAPTEGALHEAAKAGHTSAVEVLIGDLGVAVDDHEEEGGATALHLAALGGHLGASEALLRYGADAASLDSDGLTAMHYAASTGGRANLERQKAVTRRLLDAGGVGLLEARGPGGVTPLHLAAATGDGSFAAWLVLEHGGADPEAQNDAGETPADVAAKAGHAELAEALRSWRRREPEHPTVVDEL